MTVATWVIRAAGTAWGESAHIGLCDDKPELRIGKRAHGVSGVDAR